MMLKFGLSEKHTKFEKNLPYGFDKSADLLSKRQNHKADFFKLCVLFKKSELYLICLTDFFFKKDNIISVHFFKGLAFRL